MNQLVKVLTPLFFIIVYIILTSVYDKKIQPVEGYPIWMKNSQGLQAQQTSGLFFIGKEGDRKFFLSANDNGRIDRISVNESYSPPLFELETIKFDLPTVVKLYNFLPKWDFEDIVYDKLTNKILTSVEGNSGPNGISPYNYISFTASQGVYEFTFDKTILTCDTIRNVQKMQIPEIAYRYATENIGFEGMSITDNFLYIGLENISDSIAQFSDSTYLYIINRKTNDTKIIPSKLFGASSITGLCATDDYTLYGIDRDSRKIFYIKFDNNFGITETKSSPVELLLPSHPDVNLNMVAGMEAIAIDDEGNIYIDIDPWSDLYKPYFVSRKLSDNESENIKNLVPVLYKFKNPFK